LEAEPDQTIVASSNYLKRIFPFPDILWDPILSIICTTSLPMKTRFDRSRCKAKRIRKVTAWTNDPSKFLMKGFETWGNRDSLRINESGVASDERSNSKSAILYHQKADSQIWRKDSWSGNALPISRHQLDRHLHLAEIQATLTFRRAIDSSFQLPSGRALESKARHFGLILIRTSKTTNKLICSLRFSTSQYLREAFEQIDGRYVISFWGSPAVATKNRNTTISSKVVHPLNTCEKDFNRMKNDWNRWTQGNWWWNAVGRKRRGLR
jgi:hypothetical protein